MVAEAGETVSTPVRAAIRNAYFICPPLGRGMIAAWFAGGGYLWVREIDPGLPQVRRRACIWGSTRNCPAISRQIIVCASQHGVTHTPSRCNTPAIGGLVVAMGG